ncbi:MAG: lipoprotein [Pseudomonadota bacterium]
MSKRPLLLLLCSVALLGACGQKGPLFLPGDMSAGTVITPEEAPTNAEQEDDEKEESINE